MSGYATVPVRECSVCHLRAICRNVDTEILCPGCLVVVDVLGHMERVEAFRDLCMTETTVEEKFGLMGEVLGSVLGFLVDNPRSLRALSWKAEALAAKARIDGGEKPND